MKKFFPHFAIFWASLALFAGHVFPILAHAAERDSLHIVTREELARAMRQHGKYDVTKTTNAGRLQAETLLALVRAAQVRDPRWSPLFINHKDWFEVYLEVAGLTLKTAPIFARLGYEYGQDVRIEHRPERVIRSLKGPRPKAALHVTIWWPESSPRPDRYSYEDTLSVPRLQVTDHRVITYRMLDFGDMVLLDDIHGLTGRPTTGLLGLLFRLVGEGSIIETRMAFSTDGLQVVRGRAKKGFFDKTTTVTIYPDGLGIKDLPDGRADLRKIEERLKREIEVEYVPIPQESR
ncbi:MAG: hypothetical protein EXS64_11865 [Candidatus Latescibacteria bacterium]|nr:hypothetical protein [Candidatus Latescibacterota bacterium]